jgi:hypothetical protein
MTALRLYQEYIKNCSEFNRKARDWTNKHTASYWKRKAPVSDHKVHDEGRVEMRGRGEGKRMGPAKERDEFCISLFMFRGLESVCQKEK